MTCVYYIITDNYIKSPGNGKYFYGLNYIDKNYLYNLTTTDNMPVTKVFFNQMYVHTSTQIGDVIINLLTLKQIYFA